MPVDDSDLVAQPVQRLQMSPDQKSGDVIMVFEVDGVRTAYAIPAQTARLALPAFEAAVSVLSGKQNH